MRHKFDENGSYINDEQISRLICDICTEENLNLKRLRSKLFIILIRVKYNLRITSGVDSNRYISNLINILAHLLLYLSKSCQGSYRFTLQLFFN